MGLRERERERYNYDYTDGLKESAQEFVMESLKARIKKIREGEHD